MLVAIDALTKKVAAEPLKDRLASTTAAGMKKVFQALGAPANVYSDDGSEFMGHRSRSGQAGAVAPHAGRHLEPNQREEARYHAGGAEPRLL